MKTNCRIFTRLCIYWFSLSFVVLSNAVENAQTNEIGEEIMFNSVSVKSTKEIQFDFQGYYQGEMVTLSVNGKKIFAGHLEGDDSIGWAGTVWLGLTNDTINILSTTEWDKNGQNEKVTVEKEFKLSNGCYFGISWKELGKQNFTINQQVDEFIYD